MADKDTTIIAPMSSEKTIEKTPAAVSSSGQNATVEPELDDFTQPAALEADDDIDADSTLGIMLGSSTVSVGSSILKSRLENGRTYHSYKDGKYAFPDDESEKNRLDLQHHLFLLLLNGKLNLCPFDDKKAIHRVLDVGCGTGIWCMDYGDEHPESQIIGIDLSPMQPSYVPPNVRFEIDDIEESWTFSMPFDYIHVRMMTGSLSNWSRFFEQAYENTTPGGYIELEDPIMPWKCDDDSMGPVIKKWGELLVAASHKFQRGLDSAADYEVQLKAAGWTDVTVISHPYPLGTWAKNRKHKEIGQWGLQNALIGAEALSLGLLTRGLGWTPEEVQLFLVDVRKELLDPKIHLYLPMYTFYARKPL